MLDQVLAVFEITPDYDLDVMQPNQTITTSRQFLAHASEERLENIPAYVNAEADYIVSKHAARISVISEDPDKFDPITAKAASTFPNMIFR